MTRKRKLQKDMYICKYYILFMNISLCRKFFFRNIHKSDIYQPQNNGFLSEWEREKQWKMKF